MPLGVHLPNCPCARCQAGIPIVEQMRRGHLLTDTQAARVAKDAERAWQDRSPWADSGTDKD
jgi:hypothetical protein